MITKWLESVIRELSSLDDLLLILTPYLRGRPFEVLIKFIWQHHFLFDQNMRPFDNFNVDSAWILTMNIPQLFRLHSTLPLKIKETFIMGRLLFYFIINWISVKMNGRKKNAILKQIDIQIIRKRLHGWLSEDFCLITCWRTVWCWVTASTG